jgi:glycerol-3-phosphate dehydrogenase
MFVIGSFPRQWRTAIMLGIGGSGALRAVASGTARFYDVAIIGGGINGCGIARDAVGRGWAVFLCEKGDLAGATSSAASKLIHGGLRYLEYYQFRLVREALLERETLWRVAPHIIWPLRFVLPHHKGLRPAWFLRLGLFLYDHLGARELLPPTRTLRLAQDPAGAPLKPEYSVAFEYSDCWVEDSRLVVLNARDAADRGATIAPRTSCVTARREDGVWRLTLRDELTAQTYEISARAIVNAAGPWVGDVIGAIVGSNAHASVRLVKGSHIVTERLFSHDRCYIFQNNDGRVLFAIPYERDFTLIGTTDLDYSGDPGAVAASDQEVEYLCKAASDYFRTPVTTNQVVWSYSGVRPLFDDGASAAQAATRDYVLKIDAQDDAAVMLNVFGGKLTTYRKLAEAGIAMLAPYLPKPARPDSWTGKAPLPGGDFPVQGFEALVNQLQARYRALDPNVISRLARAYGTLVPDILREARSPADLGRSFGAGLTESELNYLAEREWAMSAEDVVWRRSKLGLRLSKVEIEEIDAFLKAARPAVRAAVGGWNA